MNTREDAAKWWQGNSTHVRRCCHWRKYIGEHDWNRLGREVTDRLREAFPDVEHFGDAIDMGCGGGAVSYALRDIAKVYPVDISPRCVEETFRQCELSHEHRTPPDTVDLYVCASVIQHAPSEMAAEGMIREAARLLNMGGRFLIQTRYITEGGRYDPRWDEPYEWPHLAWMSAWTIERTRELFAEYGLGIDREWTEPYRGYLWIAGRRLA